MATGYEWTCNSCGYVVETSAYHEFYRDILGQRQPHGHPLPRLDEAARAGVQGLSKHAYCPACDAVRDVIVEEFDPPENFISVWFRSHDMAAPPCPECGGELHTDLSDLECPRCGKGVFKRGEAWVT